MYWNTEDRERFAQGERAGLQASARYARLAWSRAEADAQRVALVGDPDADAHADAMRERYRVAHREAAGLEAEAVDDDVYGDIDEYGYAA